MFSITQLDYFIRVAELRSISKAAATLNVSYTAVSNQIARLEHEQHCSFFDKKGAELYLNQNGLLLYRYAIEICNSSANSIRELSDRSDNTDYEVRVSTLATPQVIPIIIEGFKKKYPHIRLRINQYQNNGRFIDSTSDVIIAPSVSRAISANSITLYKEAVMLALSKDHPLAGQTEIDSSVLASERFIRRSYRSSLRYLTDSFMQTMGIDPPVAILCDYPPYICRFVASNLGIAFMPSLQWHYNKWNSLIMAGIKSCEFYRYINISWHNNVYLSKSAQAFIGYTIDYYNSIPPLSRQGN